MWKRSFSEKSYKKSIFAGSVWAVLKGIGLKISQNAWQTCWNKYFSHIWTGGALLDVLTTREDRISKLDFLMIFKKKSKITSDLDFTENLPFCAARVLQYVCVRLQTRSERFPTPAGYLRSVCHSFNSQGTRFGNVKQPFISNRRFQQKSTIWDERLLHIPEACLL